MFQWYKLSDKAWETILHSNSPINIWEGAVRSGKTISSMIRWIEYVKTTPKNVALIMTGKTERTLKRNVLDVIVDMVGETHAKINIGSGDFKLYGRTIYLAGANDERSQEKIRGLTLGGAYCDELTLYPESFFTMLLTRLSVPGAKLFGTTNPDSPTHWLKREFIDKAQEKNITVFKFSLEDNNFLLDNNPEYIAQMKASFSGVWYRRLIEGEWCVADGAVFPQFDEHKHVVDLGDRRFKYYIVGVDYGTSNPTAFSLIGFDNPFKEKYVVKEYYWDSKVQRRQKTDAEYADDLIRFVTGYRVSAIYVDPSAASFTTQLRKCGIIPRDANNDVLDGIRFVGSELTKGHLFFDRSCEHHINQHQSYTWDEEKSRKNGVDVPLKEEDHVVDSARYALFSHCGYGPSGIVASIMV